MNTVGSYVCEEDSETGSAAECPPGYQFFLVTCVDINECHENTSTCPDSHVCVNTEGSYTCQPSETFRENNPCPAGFLETGGKCEDINECMTGEHSCLVSQRCDNTLGSYVCTRYTTCGTGSDKCCQIVCDNTGIDHLEDAQESEINPVCFRLHAQLRVWKLRGQ